MNLRAILALLAISGFATPQVSEQAAPTQAPELRAANARMTSILRDGSSLVRWIADPWRRYDGRRRGRSPRQPYVPTIDRNALLDTALARAKSRKRLVLVYVPRVEGRHMYRAPVLEDYMDLALFSDPELAALINRKFVPLRLYADKSVGKRLGLFNSDPEDPLFLAGVEPALVFLSPQGKVLHRVQRIRTFSVPWTRYVLRECLSKRKDYGRPSTVVQAALDSNKKAKRTPTDAEALLWLAREQCNDGDEDLALATLRGVESEVSRRLEELSAGVRDGDAKKPAKAARAQTMRLHARLATTTARALRLLRRPDDALALLAVVGAPEGSVEQRGLALEKARSLSLLGKWQDTRAALAALAVDGEVSYLRGTASVLMRDLATAERHLKVAVTVGQGAWRRRAAAMLAMSDDTTPFSPLAHGFELLELGSPSAYRGLPQTSEIERRGTPAAARDERVRDAFRYLLAQQLPDGSWSDARYAYWPSPRILPNVRVAITALSATALLRWRELAPARVDAALAKAERYLGDDGRLSLGAEEEVYSQAYRILYWTRRAEQLRSTRPEAKQVAFANLASLAKRAGEIQDKATGFFAHEYKNAFCTGALLWSLYLSKSIGAEVDEDTIRLGVKALLSARRKDGSFAYSGSAAQRDKGRKEESITRLKNSSARMPVCEAVLHAFGSSESKLLGEAFENFLAYLDRIAKVRKCDFHSDGELGGFFFWHALFHASEAKRLVSSPLRKKVEKRLLDLVTGFAEIDGSYVDSHELGKSYGTAMALLVLGNLSR